MAYMSDLMGRLVADVDGDQFVFPLEMRDVESGGIGRYHPRMCRARQGRFHADEPARCSCPITLDTPDRRARFARYLALRSFVVSPQKVGGFEPCEGFRS